MPTKLICHTPDCVSCGADGTCKLDGEIRVDQKRCQSYTPHSIPFMEKPLALSELPKEEWVCHILEESGATFVSLEDFYEPYGKALRRDLVWRIPYGCLDFSGCVLCLVQEGILCLPYDAVASDAVCSLNSCRSSNRLSLVKSRSLSILNSSYSWLSTAS